MTTITVKLNNYKRTPRKAGAILDLVRGKQATYAVNLMKSIQKTASNEIEKLITSGLSIATGKGIDPNNIFISEAFATTGASLKRFHPRSRGRTSAYKLTSSLVTMKLTERKK